VSFDAIRDLFGITSDCGYPASAMQPWLAKYGAVPVVLAEYYTTLGAHKALNQTQDALVIPDTNKPVFYRMSDNMDDNYLVFYVENQAVTIWGVKASDVTQDDPPVYGCSGGDDWYLTAGSVSQFLTSQAHMQAAFSYEYSSEEFWTVSDQQAAIIADLFPSKNADSQLYTGVRFYGEPGTVIMLMQNDDQWDMLFSTQNEDTYTALEQQLSDLTASSAEDTTTSSDQAAPPPDAGKQMCAGTDGVLLSCLPTSNEGQPLAGVLAIRQRWTQKPLTRDELNTAISELLALGFAEQPADGRWRKTQAGYMFVLTNQHGNHSGMALFGAIAGAIQQVPVPDGCQYQEHVTQADYNAICSTITDDQQPGSQSG